MGEIYSIVYQTGKSEQKPPYRYNRTPAQSVTLITDHGIDGDLKAGKHPARQLNIMSLETLTHLKGEGYKVSPGEMGEQLIVTGLDVDAMAVGSQLQIGADAIIEFTEPRRGCDWFEKIQDKPKAQTMGMMARVVQGGVIAVGDTVVVLQPQEA